jgi:NADH-quinone oxidoreductase subunit N
LLIGTFGGVEEKIFARFLAFSGINHIAFMLLGIICNSPQGVSASIFYLVVYAVTSLGLFIILLSVSITREGRNIVFLTDLLKIGKVDTRLGILLSTLLLSMAGLPPLPGFFSKFFVLIEAMNGGFYFLVVLGLATSVISTFYYLRLVKIILFDLANPTSAQLAIRSKLYTSVLATLEIGM